MNIDDIIENARLKGRIIALEAEVQTLQAEVRCLEAVIRSHERVDCLTVTSLKKQLVEAEAENARLKSEVERLTKAGDAMAFHYHQLELRVGNYSFSVKAPSIQAWEKAKEVQS